MNLFCIPYAGGTHIAYDGVDELLGQVASVRIAELPGRGARFGEELIIDMPTMTRKLFEQVNEFDDQPLALFGYSAGSAMAYSLARVLSDHGRPPVRVFVGAAPTPFQPPRGRCLHRMSDADLTEVLHQFGGATPEMLTNPEILSIFLPIIRADAQVVETYHPAAEPLQCPVLSFGGTDDPRVAIDDLVAWMSVGDTGSETWIFEGGHFVLRSRKKRIWSAVRAELATVAVASSRTELTGSVQ